MLSLEMTPSGGVTGLVETENQMGIFRVLGKKRGEAPPFDAVYEELLDRAKFQKYETMRSALAIESSRKYGVRFLKDKEKLLDLAAFWVSETHGQKGSTEIPGHSSKPSGHP